MPARRLACADLPRSDDPRDHRGVRPGVEPSRPELVASVPLSCGRVSSERQIPIITRRDSPTAGAERDVRLR